VPEKKDNRSWLVRVRARRAAYENHVKTCAECARIRKYLADVAEASGMTPPNESQALCPNGMELRTMWLTEPE